MANDIYSKEVIEHFQHPHNYGKIKNADGVGEKRSLICGDVMRLYIKVGKDEIIEHVSFETMGCAAAIASSSVMTDLIKGKTIKQALKINNNDIIKKLGFLPSVKIHCSLLAIDALHAAINDYLSKKTK